MDPYRELYRYSGVDKYSWSDKMAWAATVAAVWVFVKLATFCQTMSDFEKSLLS